MLGLKLERSERIALQWSLSSKKKTESKLLNFLINLVSFFFSSYLDIYSEENILKTMTMFCRDNIYIYMTSPGC